MNLILGDCLERLKNLESNSVDSVVTDPPYGLSFMDKKWDHDVPSVDIWKEVLRVLKPGGHLLSFGGTRTYHRMVVSIEDAGFEIRDQIMWLYGQGFPKSLDISKALDKLAGAEREVVGVNPSSRPNSKKAGMRGFDNRDGAPDESAGLQSVTAPATEAAKQWAGWGTALKPANEPICLARKPISESTVAKNVLKWGTGGINVDGCRNEAQSDDRLFKPRNNGAGRSLEVGGYGVNKGAYVANANPQGRFPANLLLDEEAAAALDAQTGELTSGKRGPGYIRPHGNCYSPDMKPDTREYSGDKGGASRFFYVAKVSASERNAGLEGMPERVASVGNLESAGRDPSNPKNAYGEGTKRRIEAGLSPTTPKKNHHPTVKPIKLMEYLCRLVTPPNGVVLDPFMGSGSTGVAAKRLGFHFIGIEREFEYHAIASARIDGT